MCANLKNYQDPDLDYALVFPLKSTILEGIFNHFSFMGDLI